MSVILHYNLAPTRARPFSRLTFREPHYSAHCVVCDCGPLFTEMKVLGHSGQTVYRAFGMFCIKRKAQIVLANRRYVRKCSAALDIGFTVLPHFWGPHTTSRHHHRWYVIGWWSARRFSRSKHGWVRQRMNVATCFCFIFCRLSLNTRKSDRAACTMSKNIVQ